MFDKMVSLFGWFYHGFHVFCSLLFDLFFEKLIHIEHIIIYFCWRPFGRPESGYGSLDQKTFRKTNDFSAIREITRGSREMFVLHSLSRDWTTRSRPVQANDPAAAHKEKRESNYLPAAACFSRDSQGCIFLNYLNLPQPL